MNKLRKQLISGGVGSLFVNALRAGIAFVLAVVLARVMGPSEYGSYSFALAILMLVAIPAQVGLPQLIVRETAKAQAAGNWALVRGLWRWSNTAVIAFSALGVLVASIVVYLLIASGGFTGESNRLLVIAYGIPLIPLIALISVRGACMRGLRKVVMGQLPDGVFRPMLLLVIIGFFVSAPDFGVVFSAERVVVMHGVAAFVAFVFSLLILQKVKPRPLRESVDFDCETTAWRKAVIPLAMITGLHLINNYADLVILGFFNSDKDVGVYRAVFQIALLVVFGLQSINQVLHPYFARVYELKDRHKLQRIVTLSSRVILALAIPPAVVFIIFGEHVLGWLFGAQYKSGAMALAILVAGQLASAAFGSVGALLNMTGHERDTVKGLAVAIGVNIILNIILVPKYGMEGAAVATSVSLLIWNFILHKAVWRRLSIESSALGYSKG